MKKKLLTFALAASILTFFLVSCDATPAETSSVHVSFQIVTSQTPSEIPSEYPSDEASSVESTVSLNTPSVQSVTSVPEYVLLENHETYGEVVDGGYRVKHGYLYHFRRTEGDKYHHTLCFHDAVTDELYVVDEADVEIEGGNNDTWLYTWGSTLSGLSSYINQSECLFFFGFEYAGKEKRIVYYTVDGGEKGIVPMVESLPEWVFFQEYSKYRGDGNLLYHDGEIYWAEQLSSPDGEKMYAYNIASGQRRKIYESDGRTWIRTMCVVDDGLYIKLYPIAPSPYDGMIEHSTAPGEGDLLFYDGEKMTTVAEDVYDFKLDEDGTPLVQETENGDWEELPEP